MELTINIICISYYQYLTQNKFRKYITAKGKDYKRRIEDILTEYMMDKEIKTGNIRVSLQFYFNNRRKNDIDNFAKPILDFMSNIVYEDDRQITQLNLAKYYDKENPRLIIKIEDITDNKN